MLNFNTIEVGEKTDRRHLSRCDCQWEVFSRTMKHWKLSFSSSRYFWYLACSYCFRIFSWVSVDRKDWILSIHRNGSSLKYFEVMLKNNLLIKSGIAWLREPSILTTERTLIALRRGFISAIKYWEYFSAISSPASWILSAAIIWDFSIVVSL